MATFPTAPGYVAGAGLAAALTGAANLDTNTIKVALFNNTIGTATPSKDSAQVYGSDPWNAGEVTSANYTAGGSTLTNPGVTYSAGKLIFDDSAATLAWTPVTFAPRGAVVYSTNATTANLILCTINFGSDKSVTTGTFTITWDATNGIFYATY